jgi:hypothetical protein
MHLFLRTIGFAGIDTPAKENRLIRRLIREAIAANSVKYLKYPDDNGKSGIGIIEASCGKDIGICIKGSYNGSDKFKMEYYYPYLKSDCLSNIDELSIERHADKDSYAILCDEIKSGVTLIFYLQNIYDYFKYKTGRKTICGRSVALSGLSNDGRILFPTLKSDKQLRKIRQDALVRNQLIDAARNGDEEALENLTIEDLDTYSQISQRVEKEDIYSVVDTTFMPYGIECDQYTVIGEILDVAYQDNVLTGERVCIMQLDCNDIILKAAINTADLLGEPEVGRRFKGSMWISAEVNFVY